MRQLLHKEWREHFKLALIGLAIFALMLVWNVQNGTTSFQPLLSTTLLVMAEFFCGIFGVMLGWLQIQSEKHPDLRAFLLHRPVPRTVILRSKLLAGVGLYTLGAGIPLAGLVIYVVIPGHVAAPFEWAMIRPVIGVFLLGLVFYAAGLFCALRPARWYGSRCFGLGPPIVAALALVNVQEFWQALSLVLAAGATLLAAMWGVFSQGEDRREQSGMTRLTQTAACMISSLLVCALVTGLLVNFLTTLTPGSRNYNYFYYAISAQGVLYQVEYNGSDRPSIKDLNGRPLLDEKTGQPIKFNAFNERRATGLGTGVHFGPAGPGWRDYSLRYASYQRYFIPCRIENKTLWYLTRAGRLEGYSSVTRRQVGALTPDNAAGETAVSASHFTWPPYNYNENFQPYDAPVVVPSAKVLYLVDLESRTVKPLFTATNADGIGGFSENAYIHQVLVVTRNAIQVLNPSGETELEAPYEPAYPDYTQITVSLLQATNHFAIQFDPNNRLNQKRRDKLVSQVEWVKADGEIEHRLDLPKLSAPQPEGQVEHVINQTGSLVFPPALRLGAEYFSQKFDGETYVCDRWDALDLIPAVLCALTGWVLGRRYHFSLGSQASWAVFHGLFGIPALLAFLSVQEWPAQEPCPRCQKRRRVDREQCEYCGGEFAAPEPNGTEIFESLTELRHEPTADATLLK